MMNKIKRKSQILNKDTKLKNNNPDNEVNQKRLFKIIKITKKPKTFEEKFNQAVAEVPKINQATINEHREHVLSNARKYIYPLAHTRKRIVGISLSIFITFLILFSVYVYIELYQLNSTSQFMYAVTKIVPLPVAKVNNQFVSYNSYLFQLRRYMHYYETQQNVNFSTKSGKTQLKHYMQLSMNTAIDNTLVKHLAQQEGIVVSQNQAEAELNLLKSQNRLGADQAEFNTVLSQFWGWNQQDFLRELTDEIITSEVLAKLNVSATNIATTVLAKLSNKIPFSQLANQYSDDKSTSQNGGLYNGYITPNDPNISLLITQELFKLRVGQYSGIINTGSTLEIVQLISKNGDQLKAAHIAINLKSLNYYLPKLEKQKPVYYINLNKAS